MYTYDFEKQISSIDRGGIQLDVLKRKFFEKIKSKKVIPTADELVTGFKGQQARFPFNRGKRNIAAFFYNQRDQPLRPVPSQISSSN